MRTVSKSLSCVHVQLSNFTVCRGRRSCATTAENSTKKHNTQICYFANQNVPVPVVVVVVMA